MKINEMEMPYKNTKSIDIEGEIWVSAFGFDGLYEVSNFGRIRSLDRLVNSSYCQRLHKGRVLKQCVACKTDNNIHLYVRIADGNGNYLNKTVASLILNSFAKPDKYNDTTHHINGISEDNRLCNLTFEDYRSKRRIEFDLNLRDKSRENFRILAKKRKEQGTLPKPLSIKELKEFKRIKGKGRRITRNKKPVTVYFHYTKMIRTFSCIKNASEQLGIKVYTLRNSLNKPESHTSIQVKYGILELSDFNPKQFKKRIKINGLSAKSYFEVLEK